MTINLNLRKDVLKLVLLATLTYLLFSITNNYNISQVRFTTVDTTTTLLIYPPK